MVKTCGQVCFKKWAFGQVFWAFEKFEIFKICVFEVVVKKSGILVKFF